MAQLSSFYHLVYSEIEEIGWEHLVRLGKDLSFLSFRVIDKMGRMHILEMHLDQTYPKCAPSISADVPYVCKLKWLTTSRLKDVVNQFHEHVEKLQEFWTIMDDIDRSLWVVYPKQPPRASSLRQINIGNGCFIVLSINAYSPTSLPEMMNRPLCENLASILETTLPAPPIVLKDAEQVECGICYAQCLPVDEELGAKSGSGPDYTCDSMNCRRAFHSVCLRDWLRSITTTRQSFDVLFGSCPYCSEPVAIKVGTND